MSYRKRHVKSKVKNLKPKKSIFKRRGFWYTILFLIIIFAAAYLFLFFPQIQTNNILILGNEKVKTEDINNIVSGDINKKIINIGGFNVTTKSIFLANGQIIQKDILEKYPQIAAVKIEKKFPETLNIVIQERVPAAIFCATQEAPPKDCYFIDESGIIFEALKKAFNDFAVIRREANDSQVFTGEQIIGKKIIDTVVNSEKMLKDNYQIDVADALITSPIRLNIKTTENWQIYFDLEQDTNLQIAKLNLLLKNEITQADRKNLQYIDMRFKDRAYYK